MILNRDKVVFPELTEKNFDHVETISQMANTTDKVKEFKISFFKQSTGSNNEKYDGLNGAVFQVKLKSDVDKYGWEKAPVQDEVTTVTKNGKKGYVETKYLPYSTYVVKEIKAPKGYRLLLDSFTVSFDDVNDKFTLFVDGKEIGNNDENYKLSFDESSQLYTVHMTVFNQRHSKLPDTGSAMTLCFITTGSLLCLYSFIRTRNKGERKNEETK